MTTTRWKVVMIGSFAAKIEDSDGDVVVRGLHSEIADDIVREHNAHAALVEALELASMFISSAILNDGFDYENLTTDVDSPSVLQDKLIAALRLAKESPVEAR